MARRPHTREGKGSRYAWREKKGEMEICTERLEIYTDGSCSPNPGSGGWGVVIKGNPHGRFYGGKSDTTNNAMEFQAVIEALKRIPSDQRATIYSDSQLVVNILNGRWKGKKNTDLIKEARDLMADKWVMMKWVRGHNGNKYNEIADELATRGRFAGESGQL